MTIVLVSVAQLLPESGVAAEKNTELNKEIFELGIYDNYSCQAKELKRRTVFEAIAKLTGTNVKLAQQAVYATSFYVPPFPDFVPQYMCDGYILSITALLKGSDNGELQPDQNITVQETLAILLRCLGIDPIYGEEEIYNNSVQNGLLNYSDFLGFSPGILQQPITSDYFTTLLYRMLEKTISFYSGPAVQKWVGSSQTYQRMLEERVLCFNIDPAAYQSQLSSFQQIYDVFPIGQVLQGKKIIRIDYEVLKSDQEISVFYEGEENAVMVQLEGRQKNICNKLWAQGINIIHIWEDAMILSNSKNLNQVMLFIKNTTNEQWYNRLPFEIDRETIGENWFWIRRYIF